MGTNNPSLVMLIGRSVKEEEEEDKDTKANHHCNKSIRPLHLKNLLVVF